MNPQKRSTAMLDRAERLLWQYQSQNASGLPWLQDIDGFKVWLSRYQVTCKRSTFLYYRKCLVYKARADGHEDIASELARVGAKPRKVSTDYSSVPNHLSPKLKHDVRSKRGLYAEEVSFAAVKIVMTRLHSSRQTGEPIYRNGPSASALFKAGVLTGLRPIEWANAILHESLHSTTTGERYKHVLEVDTVKQNDAIHETDSGPTKRFLILDTFSPQDIGLIELVISMARKSTNWEVHSRRFRRTFNLAADACRQEIWERTQLDGILRMYSSRHIFASEVRRSGEFDKYDLAAMMGHVDTYNQRYYGDLTGSSERRFNTPLAKAWPGVAADIRKREESMSGFNAAVVN